MTAISGWYLMSDSQVEALLRSVRTGEPEVGESCERLSIPAALTYRNAGNLPDARGRSLRLVLQLSATDDVSAVEQKRMEFEPDFHDAPTWRREGSRLVNVVPIGITGGKTGGAWWEDEDMGELEAEWRRSGTVDGVHVPQEYRSFVYKTVVGLKRAGKEVTPRTIADSVARWLPPEEADKIRLALQAADPNRT